MGRRESLTDWLAYLGTQDCTCEYQWKGLGILYGASMGSGWVRLTTAPGCPNHDENVIPAR